MTNLEPLRVAGLADLVRRYNAIDPALKEGAEALAGLYCAPCTPLFWRLSVLTAAVMMDAVKAERAACLAEAEAYDGPAAASIAHHIRARGTL